MLAHEIRTKYLEFFTERGHLRLPGAALAPVDVLGNPDNTTLFTGSGMQQFKPYFLNASLAPNGRIATVQKCIRSGDIDSVGDFSHCTFFEMLGNFSFGDYFKSEVIPWTWEFLTQVVGLDGDRMCVTVYIEDSEAYAVWHDVIGLPDDRIHRLGEDKNYWPAGAISNGPNGPCGPCSEIFYRVAPLDQMTSDPALSPTERYLLDDAAGRWTEIWNNVFTQFDRSEDENGKPLLTPLPRKNNDTGAGLDRKAYVSQGKTSVFETDLFGPTLDHIASLSGLTYNGTMSPVDFAFRVVAEHTRSAVFCIADGILPEKAGRGYVLRYILRRAIRFGKTALGFDSLFLHEVAPKIIEQMGDFYPELVERRNLILNTLRTEEETFRKTLDNGMARLAVLLEHDSVQRSKILPGSDVFKLYDTFGFPPEVTADVAAEQGITLDIAGYEEEMERQRQLSSAGNVKDVFGDIGVADLLTEIPKTEFLGYNHTEGAAKILAIIVNGASNESATTGDDAVLVLDRTPFYAESGGQVGDTGLVESGDENVTCRLRAAVTDTHKTGGIFLHTVTIQEGEARVGQSVTAFVNTYRRLSIMRNHTATHLLQAALREVLGSHVHQKGSMVSAERLRFDFTHSQPITSAEIAHIEKIVNIQALNDTDVVVHADLPIAEAKARGAMALFGEKYGERVRMIEIGDFSRELCGGTHLRHTSQLGLLKIVSQTGVSAGVRRIEAVTGEAALELVARQEESLYRIADTLKSNVADVVGAAERIKSQQSDLEKQIRQLKSGAGASQSAELTPVLVKDVPVVSLAIEGADAESLGNFADRAAKQLGTAVIVLGSVFEGKVAFVARVTPDLLTRGLHAGNLVRDVAKIAGGGGGGRPDFAQAGGKDPARLNDALSAVASLIESRLS